MDEKIAKYRSIFKMNEVTTIRKIAFLLLNIIDLCLLILASWRYSEFHKYSYYQVRMMNIFFLR